MPTYYHVEATGDLAELAARGLFLHVDAHKRSWICQQVIEGPMNPSKEDPGDFEDLVRSASGIIHGDRIVTTITHDTAAFLHGLDNDFPPPKPVKQAQSDRDVFVSEGKFSCRINDAFDATFLLTERRYDGRTTICYGTLDVTCGWDEYIAHPFAGDLRIRLEDGREGVARVVGGGFFNDPAGGDFCLQDVVIVSRFLKAPEPPPAQT